MSNGHNETISIKITSGTNKDLKELSKITGLLPCSLASIGMEFFVYLLKKWDGELKDNFGKNIGIFCELIENNKITYPLGPIRDAMNSSQESHTFILELLQARKKSRINNHKEVIHENQI